MSLNSMVQQSPRVRFDFATAGVILHLTMSLAGNSRKASARRSQHRALIEHLSCSAGGRRAAVVIELVSADSLRKTGIIADKAGDFRRFPPQVRQSGSPETKANAQKAGISDPFSRLLRSLAKTREWLAGAGGIEPPDDELEIRRSRPSESSVKPLSPRAHNQLEALEFGGPY
jgi:hypothetical protein